MKKILILISILVNTLAGAAQDQQRYGNKYEAYIYGGVSRIFCDVNTVHTTGRGGLGVGLRLNSYFRGYLDIQHGLYKGGNKNDRGQYYMQFTNRYTTVNAMARFYPFLIPYNRIDALDRFYVSAGLGLHFNNVDAHSSNVTGVGFLNNNKDISVFIPMEAGYTFPVYKWNLLPGNVYASSLNVMLGFRYNLSFSDTWDGYTPTVNANQYNDASCNIFAGVSYSF